MFDISLQTTFIIMIPLKFNYIVVINSFIKFISIYLILFLVYPFPLLNVLLFYFQKFHSIFYSLITVVDYPKFLLYRSI